VVDIRDVVETFVPFAKRLGWITRRLTGLVSSTLGSIALATIPATDQAVISKIKAPKKGKDAESLIGLGFHTAGPIPVIHAGNSSNLLGLEGISSSAPDCTAAI
jgi:hypothetical protein